MKTNAEKYILPGIDGEILRLALPAIASNITVPLLGLCDTAITGHLGSEIYLAAVAAGGTIFNVVLWLCGFLRMGTTGLTAEAFGARDHEAIRTVFWRALIFAALLGIAVVILRMPLLSLFLAVISPGAEVTASASVYFSICAWGIPPLLITLSINGWFIGMQDTVRPMVISIVMNLLNVVASIVSVYVLKAGFAGVAYGTVTANWAGLLLASILVITRSTGFSLRISPRRILSNGSFGKFFRVSSDLFLRSACMMSVSLAVTAVGARMGDLTMAANTVMLQFFLFFSYFTDGFSFAGEALIGKTRGECNFVEMRRVVKRLMLWAGGIAVVFFFIYLFFSGAITSLLTDVSNVRETVHGMRCFIWLLPPVSVMAFIYDGIFIGLTATRRMFLTTLAAALAFAAITGIGMEMVPFHDHSGLGNIILWTAFMAFLAIRGIGLGIQFPGIVRHIEKTKKISNFAE